MRNLETATALLGGLGLLAGPGAIETDDPFTLLDALRAGPRRMPLPRDADFLPLGTPREMLKAALASLRDALAVPATSIPLPAGAAFGAAHVADGCTLCLACTMV